MLIYCLRHSSKLLAALFLYSISSALSVSASAASSEIYSEQGYVPIQPQIHLHYIAKTQINPNLPAKKKPLLLFIHGAPERAEVWQDYQDYFSEEYFTVAYNSRGYYPSSIPSEVKDYELDKLAEDAVDVAKYFGYDEFTVVGHDWGAATAWQTAIDFPKKVKRLIIFSNPHPVMYARAYYESAKHRELLDAYIPLARNNIAPWTREATIANNVRHYKEYVYTEAANQALTPELAALLEETWTYDNGASVEAIYNHYKALDWPLLPLFTCKFFFFSLAAKQPVLLFYGDEDRFVSSESFELKYNNCNPNTWYVNFPDGDHFIHHVYKEEIFADMEMFLGLTE